MNIIYTVADFVGGTPGDSSVKVFHSKMEAVEEFKKYVERAINFVPSKQYEIADWEDLEDGESEELAKSLENDGCTDVERIVNITYYPESSLSYDHDGGWWGTVEITKHELKSEG